MDTGHGGFGIETVQDLVSAAKQAGITPFVCVCDLRYSLVAASASRRCCSITNARGYGLCNVKAHDGSVTIAADRNLVFSFRAVIQAGGVESVNLD